MSYLQVSWRYLFAQRLLFAVERQILDAVQRVHDLADDVIAREAIEAQHDEMQRDRRQLIVVDAVEREDLVVDGIQRLAQYTRLNLVTFVGQQLQLDVRI